LLRSRIITALILAPLALSAVYLLPLWGYAVFFGVVAALGAYEWGGLAGLGSSSTRLIYVAVLVVLILGLWRVPVLWESTLWLGAAFWAVAAAAVLGFPASGRFMDRTALLGAAGLLAMLAAWVALVVIRAAPGGANWVVWLLVLIWSADIGAYFAGRAFGRRKLAPSVSPGKTWEGAVGGALLSLLMTTAGLLLMGAFTPWWLLLIVLLVTVSVFGDLFESALKRHLGVKDSGALLPGHGGILDRIDSVIAVLPVFALLLGWLASP
jgi:phosphatidate cytidylyltransferase